MVAQVGSLLCTPIPLRYCVRQSWAIPLLCTPNLLSQKGPVEPITVCAIDFRLAA